MKKILKIVLGVGLLFLFLWTLYFLYKKSDKPEVVYKTEQPFVTNIIKKTVATGSVIPRKEIEIKPQVSGILEEIYVEPGQTIRKGDAIAKIGIIPNAVNLNAAESRLNQAQINFQNAKRDLDRAKDLFQQKVISQVELQSAELAYNSAQQELTAARNNLELIRKGSVSGTKLGGNTVVRATIDGMVLTVPVEEGFSVIEANTFNAGTTIATVANMGEMIFQGKVDESEVGKIRQGMDLILTIGAIEDAKFGAQLEYIAPKGVEENGAIQFEIKAAMQPAKEHFIRAGYSANADIVLARKDSVLAISESLLQFEGDKAFVEVQTGEQKYEKRFVKTGLSDGINIEILEGISAGDKLKNPNPQAAAAKA